MTPRQYTDRIISRIANTHGLTLEEVTQHSKQRATVRNRHQVWLDVCLELDWTTSQIARRLNRDHSTIIYGRQKAAEARYGLPPKASWAEIESAARNINAQERAA